MKLFPKLIIIGALAAALIGSCFTIRAMALPNEATMSFVNTDDITVGILDNVEVDLRIDVDIPAIISTLEYLKVIITFPPTMLTFDTLTLPSSMPSGFVIDQLDTDTPGEVRFVIFNGFQFEPVWAGPFAELKWKAEDEGEGFIGIEVTYGSIAGRSTVQPPAVGGYAMNGSGTWFGHLNTPGIPVPVEVLAAPGGGCRGCGLNKPNANASTWGRVKALYKR